MVISTVVFGVLGGCTAPVAGTDQRPGNGQPDATRRQMNWLLPIPRMGNETATALVEIPIPFDGFSRWSTETKLIAYEKFMTGSVGVPDVSRTEALSGNWDLPGDRRLILFVDGTSAIEEILDVGPGGFRYQVSRMTSDTGRFVDHAVSEFAYEAVPKGTKLVWTYSFSPKIQPFDGWFIRSYVENEFRSFMQQNLAALRERVMTDMKAANR